MTECSAPPPPPTPDFTLSVSPSSVETYVGTTTTPVAILVTGQTGFTGAVSVSLQEIPAGITVSPSSSFLLAAGASQPVTFFFPDTTSVGGTAITVLASSGSHSHTAQLTLTANAIVRTYQVGSVLYLESGNAVDVARVGLDTAWGGSIVEVSLNRTEFVLPHNRNQRLDGKSFLPDRIPSTASTVLPTSVIRKTPVLTSPRRSCRLLGGNDVYSGVGCDV
jgi:hypothetical protein